MYMLHVIMLSSITMHYLKNSKNQRQWFVCSTVLVTIGIPKSRQIYTPTIYPLFFYIYFLFNLNFFYLCYFYFHPIIFLQCIYCISPSQFLIYFIIFSCYIYDLEKPFIFQRNMCLTTDQLMHYLFLYFQCFMDE